MTQGPTDAAPAAAAPFRNDRRLILLLMFTLLYSIPRAPNGRRDASYLQILLPDLFVGFQFLRAAAEYDLSLGHHVHAVRQAERCFQGLLDQQDRRAVAMDLGEYALDLLHDHRREPLGRFIH